MEELENIEAYFKVNINVYCISEDFTDMIRHSQCNYKSIMNLNLHHNHFSFIKDIHNITKVFKCSQCHQFLSLYKLLKRHLQTCNKGVQKIQYVGGNYQNKETIFELLGHENIDIPNDLRYYPYFLFFDFETYLKKLKRDKTKKLQYDGEHELLSICFMGNEDPSPTFIPVDETPEKALEEMIVKMDVIRIKYIEQMYSSYVPYFKAIAKITGDRKKEQYEKTRRRLASQLMDWIEEMPVYGFNSSSYDLNVIKSHLPEILIKHGRKHGNISKKEKQWIKMIELELGYAIEKNVSIDRFTVDGFDVKTNTVYEFDGCYFHGCELCFDGSKINPLSRRCQTMSDLNKKTLEKRSKLKSLGYRVKSQRECEFKCTNGIEVKGIIKQNNRYRMIANGKFIFKDVMNYLAPGYSLDKFLKAFDTSIPKGIFCHKVTQNLDLFIKHNPGLQGLSVIDVLKKSPIPAKNWFYNVLKAKPICNTDYEDIKLKYSNIYELLVDYNKADVAPSVEAMMKLSNFFKVKGLDMHKDGISISGLTLKYLWKVKDRNANFQLFKEYETLHQKYRDNLVGGPSIVFNHYQEKGITKIRGGKFCESVKGFDANALYLYALGGNMLVGDHKIVEYYPEILDDVINDKFFGVVECNIRVPEELRDYFQEFTPIFKNVDITYNDVSEETKAQVKENYKSRKLIGSMFGTKMLFHTDLLKWYMKHGLIVDNVSLIVSYHKSRPFKSFMEEVSEARRKGDISKDYELIGDMNKLMGNSSYGGTIMNKLKHERVSIISNELFSKNMKSPNYKSHEDLINGYEFRMKKMRLKENLPIQVGFAVYQLAKLRMLEFYYDFIDRFIDRSDFQYVQTDTDSAYCAFSSNDFDCLVKPHLKEEYNRIKSDWFGRDDTPENKLYDKRTPGLFKLEYEGDGIIALSAKMYYSFNEKTNKFSSKGINKHQNDITKERYMTALGNDPSQTFLNKGFRVLNNRMTSYSQLKTGMKLFNDKRKLIGYETTALDI